MNENPECNLCDLSSTCSPASRCLKGEGGRDEVKMVIFLDAPTIVEDRRKKSFMSDAAELLKFLLRRMSIRGEHVYLDYVVKCYPKPNKNYTKKAHRAQFIESCSVYRVATLQLLKPKVIVAMGAVACETFMGSNKVSQFEGTYWTPMDPKTREHVDHVWVTYAPGYALESPAESVGIYRTLFKAAEMAGLRPRFDKTVKLFDYGT